MLTATSSAALAQDGKASTESADPVPSAPQIQFVAGTGDGAPAPGYLPTPLTNRSPFACAMLADAKTRLLAQYGSAPATKRRLDSDLLQAALASYWQNHCALGQSGPSVFAVVDFAKRSSEPRLWYVDLPLAGGIDSPVLVAHGSGSDPDRDGYANRFSNVYDSRMSTLGAMRGAERYVGRNGLSLRLDGLELGNNLVRHRDIVVHTARPNDRNYFSFEARARLNGAIGFSDGCFVVEPHERERLMLTLEQGGFLYAGIGALDPGRTMPEIITVWPPAPILQPVTVGNVVFVPGTGE
jgi:hypothetical protein